MPGVGLIGGHDGGVVDAPAFKRPAAVLPTHFGSGTWLRSPDTFALPAPGLPLAAEDGLGSELTAGAAVCRLPLGLGCVLTVGCVSGPPLHRSCVAPYPP